MLPVHKVFVRIYPFVPYAMAFLVWMGSPLQAEAQIVVDDVPAFTGIDILLPWALITAIVVVQGIREMVRRKKGGRWSF
ncbi:hypothetical protein [Pontibacter sp. G13]|uniref:hypothetical protein n=1 Tax=Pontibacter sp. G13 TaxID=3074898 RepID=UPI002889FFF2|nr:hypothetical protein [Pontibacter sp. G13]WNJ21569.1 hypothetical protein RJD25_28955 [Pontibacter sp. G13]